MDSMFKFQQLLERHSRKGNIVSCNLPWRLIELWDVKVRTFSRQSPNSKIYVIA
jgi:hypothetical protein